jgi:diguanylate cyclase (GGDEF)-like protein
MSTWGGSARAAESHKALGFLARLASEFTAVLSLPDLLGHVMRVLREETGFDSCSLALQDVHDPNALVILAASGLRKSFRGLRLPVGQGLHGAVMETGRPLLVPDMDADPRVFRREPRIKSGIYAPLMVRDRRIGILSAHQDRVGAFAEADLDLLTVVARYLSGAIEVARLHEQLKELAATDSLTGLANRRTFLDRLESEIARSRRAKYPLSVVLVDLDRFKSVNDVYGHARGDEVLIGVGENVARVIRDADLAARFGGDEFILMLPETTRTEAKAIIGRLRAMKIPIQGREGSATCLITVSWGAAAFPEDGQSLAQLLQKADSRLYEMKDLEREMRCRPH